MANIFLQEIIEDISLSTLPYNWNSFDFKSFSKDKHLWNFQQKAIENAIKVLWKYYEDIKDFQKDEKLEVNEERKKRLFEWYKDNGLEEDLDIRLDKRSKRIFDLLTEYYFFENGKIPYWNYINRMCFWMATGSGKTLIIIKLIQILTELIRRGEVPPNDILVLTYRDDLIEQFKEFVKEFNYASELKIILRELKEYPEVKRQPLLWGITVFYYKSLNIVDEQGQLRIDFRNYDNDGRWYIFLDEAHKGDKQLSKAQHIYSILSRNGFLFNSSATFIDSRDVITCAFEFNLATFINSGYGKHIGILKQEMRAFRDDEDYNKKEKQKVVLKSLILLTYVKKFYEDIKNAQSTLYHKPLLLTLVNSVNTEDADLKLFFRELEKIGKDRVKEDIFKSALDELWDELKQEPRFIYEGDKNKIKVDDAIFKNITKEDILNYVFNSKTSGEIEILRRPANKKELAFKLKTSDRPFALIKIGDVSGWLKNEFAGYEIQERFEDEGYFENLNREDSEINILMGSRAFYEGWDSNRPNVINFINIGVGQDARKFILQSIGRGVRIEPIKDKRKRLLELYNSKEIADDLFHKIKDKVLPIETLFIFGTNRKVLIKIVEELKKEKKEEGELSLFKNVRAQKYKLLVPVYKQAEHTILEKETEIRFGIAEEDLKLLKKFIEFIQDGRILLMRYKTKPIRIKALREYLNYEKFRFTKENIKSLDVLIQKIFDYFGVIPERFDSLKELEEEIEHYQHIKVYFKNIDEVQRKIEAVKDFPQKRKEVEKELSKLSYKTRQEIQNLLIRESSQTYEYKHKKIEFKYIANHYYIPLILSSEEKIDYIKHIIKTQSEVKFIYDLESYLTKGESKFKKFDRWMFSKIDESLDKVYIPYYDPKINRISRFYPDFIFWLKKGDNYFIIFVDPKGIEHLSGWEYKIDYGYKWLFEDNERRKTFNPNGFKVKIILRLRTDNISKVPPPYRKYWFDNIGTMLEDG